MKTINFDRSVVSCSRNGTHNTIGVLFDRNSLNHTIAIKAIGSRGDLISGWLAVPDDKDTLLELAGVFLELANV